MNFQVVGQLVGLRYRLLWARTRSRNGRIALFVVGYLIFVLVAMLVGAGGVGAGLVAMRSGKAPMVAEAVLGSLFIELIFVAVLLGFGLNTVFSDAELRRYPVGIAERRVTCHLVSLVDPFWLLGFALDVGLVIGLYVMGAGSLGLGLAAVLLLFVSNYLAARVVAVCVDRLMQGPIGSMVLMALILGMGLGAGQIPRIVRRSPAAVAEALRVLHYTPPFGAASAITGKGSEAAAGLAILACWLMGLVVGLNALERLPARPRKPPKTAISFLSVYDRIGAWFGSGDAPLVATWLRYYLRNVWFRSRGLLLLPLFGFLTYAMARPRGDQSALFVAALSTFPIIAFIAPARFAVNQFGYTGSGFRRYFLLPSDQAAPLRTGNFASMLIGVALLLIAGIVWATLVPGPFDPHMLFMLFASGIAGLLVFHGVGLWTSVLGPRRIDYNQSFGGNGLPLAGNIVLFGGVLGCLVTPHLLKVFAPLWISPQCWWLATVPVAFAIAFYIISLRSAGSLLGKRREQLMALVEGRD